MAMMMTLKELRKPASTEESLDELSRVGKSEPTPTPKIDLDLKRDYATVTNSGDPKVLHFFEQGDKYFNAQGMEIDPKTGERIEKDNSDDDF